MNKHKNTAIQKPGIDISRGVYFIGLLTIFLISPLVMYFHEKNMPPQISQLRLYINLILLFLAMGYYFFTLQCQKQIWRPAMWASFLSLGVLYCLIYPVFSGDIMEYLIRGRMLVLHGLNPFGHVPEEVPHDSLFSLCTARKVGQLYGPLALGMQSVAVIFFKNSLTGMIWLFKAQMLVFLALGGWALGKIADRMGIQGGAGLGAAFALNPMLVIFTLVDGHNDIAMVSLTLLAVYLLIEKRFTASFLIWSCAFLVKYPAAFVLPYLVIYAVKQKAKEGNFPWGFIFKQLAVNTAFIVFAFALVWGGPGTYTKLDILVTKFFDNCFPYAVHQAISLAGFHVTQSAVKLFFTLGYFAAIFYLMVVLWLKKERVEWMLFFSLAWVYGLSYLSMSNGLWGWYFIWAFPWILLFEFPSKWIFVTLYSFTALFSYFKRPNYLIVLAALVYFAAWLIAKKYSGPKTLSFENAA